MFDRRSAAKNEWSIWWRYATGTGVLILLVAAMMSFRPTGVFGVTILVIHLIAQLVILGMATAALVHRHVREYQAWIGGIAGSLPLLAYPSLINAPLCLVICVVVSVAWFIAVLATSTDIFDPRYSHVCKTCFYDLRGLRSTVCPECGTDSTSP